MFLECLTNSSLKLAFTNVWFDYRWSSFDCECLFIQWLRRWSWESSRSETFIWHFEMTISRTKFEDDELLTARSIELDRWFRSWVNAERQIECRCERNERIEKFDNKMKMRFFWMKFLNDQLLIWRYQLINMNSSLISARDVVWLRQYTKLIRWRLIVFSS